MMLDASALARREPGWLALARRWNSISVSSWKWKGVQREFDNVSETLSQPGVLLVLRLCIVSYTFFNILVSLSILLLL